MKILISGASGLVGSALQPALRAAGHDPVALRRPFAANLPATLDAAGALIHLAGAPIAEHRWTPRRKQLLRDSRIVATNELLAQLRQLPRPPAVVIAASAVGYYGNRDNEALTESKPPGEDFLARLVRDWETAALAAEDFGARVVLLRFGIILDAHGGALPRLLLPFRLGLGGRLGSGHQWTSWITLADVLALIQFALTHPEARGALNAVAPDPVTNADFTRALARALHRPAVLPVPAFVLRLLLGELADTVLLASQRAVPERLQELGFAFRHPTLPEAFASLFA